MKDDGPVLLEGELLKFNHYTCQKCGAVTVTHADDPGVTPFIIRCRATAGCSGDAVSGFYRVSQDPAQVVHLRWFRPAEGEALDAYLAQFSSRGTRRWVEEHVRAGGVVPREANAL